MLHISISIILAPALPLRSAPPPPQVSDGTPKELPPAKAPAHDTIVKANCFQDKRSNVTCAADSTMKDAALALIQITKQKPMKEAEKSTNTTAPLAAPRNGAVGANARAALAAAVAGFAAAALLL